MIKRFMIFFIFMFVLTICLTVFLYGGDVFTQTEHGGNNIDSDSFVLSGSCESCHVEHDSQMNVPVTPGGPYEYMLKGDNNNDFCGGCHVDSTIGTPPTKPPLEGLWVGNTRYDSSAHGTSFYKTNPDTGFDLPLCISCHDTHGRGTDTPYPALRANDEENLCYSCHDSNGPAVHDIKSKMAGTATSTNPISGSWARVNTRHDISDADQSWSGARIECRDCHNPHLNNSDYNGVDRSKVRDPSTDPNTTAGADNFIDTYNVNDPDRPGDLDPNILPESPASPVPDYVDFCLVCHDGSYPSWINPGTNPPAAINWESTSGDYHGGKYGGGYSGKGYLKSRTPSDPGYISGYTGADYRNLGSYTAADSYAPMLCTDCHDPHGVNNNLFMIKETINNKSGISWTDGGVIYFKMCSACHGKLSGPHKMYGDLSTCSKEFHSHGGGNF